MRYNTLNLPDAMQFYQGHQTNYTYNAAGAKLRVVDKTAPAGAELPVTSLNTVLTNPSVAMTTTTDYVGNMIYENGTLKRMLTSEGYWQAGTYYYFLKDHLGSNRVVITGSGAVVESSSYYPSGMRFGESAAKLNNSVQPYRHTGHEMQEMHGLNWIDNLARFRTVSDGGGFTGVDPLCEKYYWISPYAYCANNPINRIDPDGMDDYRYEDKTGDFHLMKKTDDKTDKVLGYHLNKKTGGYEQNTKWYQSKTRIDEVEKGILNDGINFKGNNNVIEVGGEGQATVDGVEAFAVNLSDMVGKEIGGAYFSKDGAESTTHISIGKYENNSLTETKGSGHSLWNKLYPDSKLENSLTSFFHTHPSSGNISVTDRTTSSKQDRDSRDEALNLMPVLRFYILTHQINYGDKFPYKKDYTNE